MANNTSPHIMNTSANLLGLCLFVITSLHIASQTENHLIDEFTSVIALFLTASCIISFISIRSKNPVREKNLENIADYIFLFAISGILVVILLITLNYIT